MNEEKDQEKTNRKTNRPTNRAFMNKTKLPGHHNPALKKHNEKLRKAALAREAKKRRERKMKELKEEKQILALEGSLAESRRQRDHGDQVRRACEEVGLDPVLELVKRAKAPRTPPVEKVRLLKILVDKMVPDVKAIDIQQEMKMTVNVEVTAFGDVKQRTLKAAEALEIADEAYEEFEEPEQEDQI